MAYENLQYKSKKILFYLYLEWHHPIQVNAFLKIMAPNQILLIKKKNMRNNLSSLSSSIFHSENLGNINTNQFIGNEKEEGK